MEGLDMDTEEWRIEGVDTENEAVESESEEADNFALPRDRKGYFLYNHSNMNYNI